jgi:hypothetical protein
MVTAAASRFVQEKNESTPNPAITPGTVNTRLVKGAGSGLSTTPESAGAAIRASSSFVAGAVRPR